MVFWVLFSQSELSLRNTYICNDFVCKNFCSILYFFWGGIAYVHGTRAYIQEGRMILWCRTMAERGISVPSLYFQALQSFLLYYLCTASNIMRDYLIVSKRNPLNFCLWQILLPLASEWDVLDYPVTEHLCLSESVSDGNLFFLLPIRLKSARNDSLNVPDLDLRDISLQVYSDSHECFILTIWLF